MNNFFEHIVSPEEAGTRLDVLVGSLPGVASRSAAERLIEQGNVLVGDEVSSKKYRVVADDVIRVDVPDTVDADLIPEYIPLDIRFEDDDMIVLSKQDDLVVHPAEGNWTGTLVHGLLTHSTQLGSLQGDLRPGIVHRLDKDTSGLMMVAKTNEAQLVLQEDIKIKQVKRRYLTLVHGWIAPDTGLIDAPIGRDETNPMRRAVSDSPGAKQSVTTFNVLERFEAGRFDDGYTLVECKLYTGRTHQIRVHMAYIKHPIVGDQMYGGRKSRASRGLSRQFLHSYRLELQHPITHEPMIFLDSLPQDLQAILDEITPDSVGRTARGDEVFAELAQARANHNEEGYTHDSF